MVRERSAARVVCEGSFAIDVAPDRALDLFTPEGERIWVADWDPTYPAGAPSDTVGTVFQTQHDGHDTIWTIAERGATLIRYVRVTPGRDAGIVLVRLEPAEAGGTRVAVTYDLTALSGIGRDFIAAFAAGYEDYLADWATAITAAHPLDDHPKHRWNAGGRSQGS